jgi:diketogulonate reductase-like aldo/keto reductase
VALPSGEAIAALGLGTWRLGEQRAQRQAEIEALRLGIDLGMNLVDTAEMYCDGATEDLVGEALVGRRDGVFLVSKVYPHNATRRGIAQACERSLKRLRTDRIDLYLLHWRGSVPLADTLAGFADLTQAGKIRHWGVSNLDAGEMAELAALPGGAACATDQVLYNLTRRGVEWDLLPWCRGRQMPVMAYSPLEQTRLFGKSALREVAKRHGATEAQVALAWLLQQDGVLAIPKAGTAAHVRENHGALAIALDAADRAALDHAYPPPRKASPLAML